MSACAELEAGPFFEKVISVAWGETMKHGTHVGAPRTFCGVRIPHSGVRHGRILKGARASSSVECKRCAEVLPGEALLPFGGLS